MFQIQGTDLQYRYMGYEYRTYEDCDDDNVKMFHLCFRDGVAVGLPREFADHSPYSLVDVNTFKRLIDSQLLIDFMGV